ncbi:MAG TPA: hypothetical protein VJW20_00205 [Candidatus Angelobacter sp.]|nr:hypothetical protein [Candidatus Angelobacter sp.]
MKKRLEKKLLKKLEAARTAQQPIHAESPEWLKVVALESWRIRKLLPEFSDNKKHRVLGSSVEKILEALSQNGIDVDDPEGQDFRDGMTLEVVMYEEKADMPADKCVISETLSPAIYVQDKVVQPAKVIVSIGKKVK